MLHNDKRFMCSLSRIPPEVGQCCSLPTLRPSLSDSYSSIMFIPCSDLDFVQLTRKLALNRWEYLTPRKGVCKVYRRETNQESDKEKRGGDMRVRVVGPKTPSPSTRTRRIQQRQRQHRSRTCQQSGQGRRSCCPERFQRSWKDEEKSKKGIRRTWGEWKRRGKERRSKNWG
jgi:hypothetical protein